MSVSSTRVARNRAGLSSWSKMEATIAKPLPPQPIKNLDTVYTVSVGAKGMMLAKIW